MLHIRRYLATTPLEVTEAAVSDNFPVQRVVARQDGPRLGRHERVELAPRLTSRERDNSKRPCSPARAFGVRPLSFGAGRLAGSMGGGATRLYRGLRPKANYCARP